MQEYRTLEEHMTAVKGIGLGGIPIGIRQKAAAALRISFKNKIQKLSGLFLLFISSAYAVYTDFLYL